MTRKKTQDVVLEVVCTIGRAIAEEAELPDLLELIYRETGRVMDTECFMMGLYNPTEDSLQFDLVYDKGERLEPLVLRREGQWGLSGRVFDERAPIFFKDLQETGLPEEAVPFGDDIPRSWMGVPLIARERVLGVMSVQSYNPNAFSEADQRLLEAVASQAAVALENFYLRREHERRISELSALSEIGQAIIRTTDQEELLEVIYRETSRVMDTSNLYVALYREEEELVSFDYFMQDGERIRPDALPLSAGGLTVHIVTRRQPVLIGDDLTRELEELEIPLVGRPAESYLGVPMMAGDRVIGVLSVQNPDRRRAFNKRHQTLLINVANLAAVAVENARLSRDREKRLTELAILNEIGRVLSSSLELDQLLDKVHEQVSRVFDTTNFYIALYEEEPDEWILAFCREHGQPDPRVGNRYKVGAGLTGHIIRTQQPILLRSVVENVEFHENNDIPFIGEQSRSWLGVPLISADKVVGVTAIQSYEQEFLYDEQDLSLLSTIAAHTAIAVENAHLVKEWQEQLTDLTVLNEVAQAILSADTEEELLESIYHQVGRVMDSTNFYVALYDEGDESIDFGFFVEAANREEGPGRYKLTEGSLTAYIVRQREALFLVEDIEAKLAERGIVGKGRPARSYMGVPMMVGERVIGAMALQSYEREAAYTSRHFDLFTNIATQAATAVQQLRLRSSEERKARQLSIIGEVSRKVTAILDLDELLRELARSIQLGFGYTTVAVFRVDEEVDELVLGALVGRYAGILEWGFRQPIHEGLAGWTAQSGEVVLCNDILEDPRYVRGFDAEDLTRAELCVPIQYGNRVIGVLDLQAEQPDAFDDEDVAAMETLAGQLAAAMRNAILFRERGQQLANLNALNRVIQAAASALSLTDLLMALCDVVVDLMTPDGFFVALRDEQTGDLVARMLIDEGVRYEDYVLTPGTGFTSHLMNTGEPILIRNMDEERSDYPVEHTTMGSGKSAATWLGVPLKAGDECIGAIVVQSYRNYAFDEADLEFLQTVASQVLVNIDKARLFEETQLALEEIREASSRQQRLLDMIRELSTPLVPITDEILVLPLVGTIDSLRAQQMMDVLLDGISARRAKVVILDITGVPVVDTSVANYILQATQAVRLLGATCILVGITPEVAQTVVGLGVELQALTTRSDLQGGVEHALQLLGQQISKPKKKSPLLRDKIVGPGVQKPEQPRSSPSR
jgi:GAF domain-containing protein